MEKKNNKHVTKKFSADVWQTTCKSGGGGGRLIEAEVTRFIAALADEAHGIAHVIVAPVTCQLLADDYWNSKKRKEEREQSLMLGVGPPGQPSLAMEGVFPGRAPC